MRAYSRGGGTYLQKYFFRWGLIRGGAFSSVGAYSMIYGRSNAFNKLQCMLRKGVLSTFLLNEEVLKNARRMNCPSSR